MTKFPQIVRTACLAAVGLGLAACSSNPDRVDRPENPFKVAAEGPGGPKSPLSDQQLRLQADQLYRQARAALDSADYSTAIKRYDQLVARYPFSDYSTQAELEKIFALYKSYQPDEAVAAADRFLRAHPRHPHADYVMYLKGLADFDRDQGLMSEFGLDNAKKDVSSEQRAFEDFALLAQRYPHSRYLGDARRRMIYCRNRIADHALSVARFYVSRGAYVAAAKRATDIIAQYPGAPATQDALKILELSYRKLHMDQQAQDAATLIALNPPAVEYADAPKLTPDSEKLLAENAALPPPAPVAENAAATTPAAPQRHGFKALMKRVFDVVVMGEPLQQPTTNKPAADKSGTASTSPPATTVSASASAADKAPNGAEVTASAQPQTSSDAASGTSDAGAGEAKTQTAAAPAQTHGFGYWMKRSFNAVVNGEPLQPQPEDQSSGGKTGDAPSTKRADDSSATASASPADRNGADAKQSAQAVATSPANPSTSSQPDDGGKTAQPAKTSPKSKPGLFTRIWNYLTAGWDIH
ncbi:MAG: outer membrane protein assembly factor BamD [Sinobacteraceae bacterium]|nr:outer membrane protein assembly factor BamD [Nevskiaceae bacterium]